MDFFTEVLSQNSYGDIVTATNGGEARRLLIERDFDLCIIFGNLLDNAIEACSKMNNIPKEIFIKVRMQHDIIYIYVKNTSYKYPKKIDGKFITSKKNKEYHGIGIESVRKSVEKYNGHLDFDYDNNMFRTTIIINT